MKVLLTIHEIFYIIQEMIPKVSKAKRGLSYRTDRASNKDARSVFTYGI